MKSSKSVPLSPKFDRLVAKKVASGKFRTAQEVVQEALSLLEARDRARKARIESINAGIDRGLADARAGREVPFDRAAVEGIKRRGRERLSMQRQRKSA